MRVCTRCQQPKPDSEFSTRSGKVTNQCLSCKREYNNRYYNNKSVEGKKEKLATVVARKDELRRKLWEYKSSHSCEHCGESDPIVLEFDHLASENKESEITTMVKLGFSWENILKEIQKCRVLCANCHRRRTYHQLGWYGRI